MTNIEVSDSTIQISGTTHKFAHEIGEVVKIDGIVAVLLLVATDETNNRNVVGFDQNGSFLWKIEELYPDKEDIPFAYLGVHDGELIADSWMGVRATIDPQTGMITDTTFTK